MYNDNEVHLMSIYPLEIHKGFNSNALLLCLYCTVLTRAKYKSGTRRRSPSAQ